MNPHDDTTEPMTVENKDPLQSILYALFDNGHAVGQSNDKTVGMDVNEARKAIYALMKQRERAARLDEQIYHAWKPNPVRMEELREAIRREEKK